MAIAPPAPATKEPGNEVSSSGGCGGGGVGGVENKTHWLLGLTSPVFELRSGLEKKYNKLNKLFALGHIFPISASEGARERGSDRESEGGMERGSERARE